MKLRLFNLFICMLLFVQCGGAEGTSQEQSVENEEVTRASQEKKEVDTSQQAGLASEDVAVSIASEDAIKAYGSLENYNVIGCEQKDAWLIIFAPKNTKQDDLLEYQISKRGGGWILWKEKIPPGHTATDEQREEAARRPTAISKEEAIAITKKDALSITASHAQFNITACELPSMWFIVYELKEAAMGGGRQYLIEKGTGKLLYKKYSQ